MSDHVKLVLETIRSRLNACSGRHLTGAVVGGGFLAGMVLGAIFLFGGSDETAGRTPDGKASAARGDETSPSADAQPSTDGNLSSDELLAERDRLKQELEAARLRQEVEALRRELRELQTSPVSLDAPREPSVQHRSAPAPTASTPTASNPQPVTEPANVAVGAATLEFWNRMNEIILKEATLRAAPSAGITATNAAGFFDARIQAAEFALDGMRELPTKGVDEQVLRLAEKLAHWYDEGRRVAETGKRLLTGGSIKERQGAAGKQYQAAERKHSEAVNAINTQGEQVRQAMSRKYGLKFPPLN